VTPERSTAVASDRYRIPRSLPERVTDTDRSVDGESIDPADSGTLPDGVDPDDVPEFGDLSILQRAFVAAAQNPSRGVLVVGLFAFAIAFYAAFWLSFPRAAGLLSALALIVAAVAAVVYWLLDRVSR
jgi:hypothetical protein